MARKKVKTGSPIDPAGGKKPPALGQPPHGTHPMIKGVPSKGNMGRKGGRGGCC